MGPRLWRPNPSWAKMGPKACREVPGVRLGTAQLSSPLAALPDSLVICLCVYLQDSFCFSEGEPGSLPSGPLVLSYTSLQGELLAPCPAWLTFPCPLCSFGPFLVDKDNSSGTSRALVTYRPRHLGVGGGCLWAANQAP